MALRLHLFLAVIERGILHLCRGKRIGREDGGLQLYAFILRLRTVKVHVQGAALLIAFDLDRVIGVVFENIIRRAVNDRRVLAELCIRHCKAVVPAADDLQVGIERGHIKRRGDLADAPANTVDDLPLLINERVLKAAFIGARPHHFVVGKLVARVEDRSVYKLRRQTHVRRAGHVAGV